MLGYLSSSVQRLLAWVRLHHKSILFLWPLVGGIAALDVATFTAGFGSNDDPGTYTAQAWAVLYRGQLSHYTYWYDHPPLGWIQIALYAWVVRGFDGHGIDILMSSGLMVLAQLTSCVLIFAFMRRIGLNRAFAALGVVLFAASPLAVYYQKLAFLDNLAVTWLLASMVFAVSLRRSLASAFGAGVCLAVSVLTKETSGVWLLVVVYLLWQNHHPGYRGWVFAVFSVFVTIGFFYVLLAVLKGELLPGKGHVSLWEAFIWQLTRPPAGTDTVSKWLQTDHWLLFAAIGAMPLGLVFRRLRPVTVGFVVLVVLVARGGYVPAPFVIGMLPFAALLVAGALGYLWPYRSKVVVAKHRWLMMTRAAAVLAVLAAGLGVCVPGWTKAADAATSRADVMYYQQTVEWVERNVPKDAVIAVDDNTWPDLYRAGYHNVVWFYKLDLDPTVKQKYVPEGYTGISYIAMKQLYVDIARDSTGNSVISQAVKHSQLMAQFGDPGTYTTEQQTNLYEIYKVGK